MPPPAPALTQDSLGSGRALRDPRLLMRRTVAPAARNPLRVPPLDIQTRPDDSYLFNIEEPEIDTKRAAFNGQYRLAP
jgi:hypothetical protein